MYTLTIDLFECLPSSVCNLNELLSIFWEYTLTFQIFRAENAARKRIHVKANLLKTLSVTITVAPTGACSKITEHFRNPIARSAFAVDCTCFWTIAVEQSLRICHGSKMAQRDDLTNLT
ncbi:hypothetical protein RRG08_008002 [Elysia crispata]|uniref:Uncharacterized protein n=1 Tax=Elysia crispata TaxID=231223 RepID=A0AAE1B148_9GAST|nr:hypothetical protein RRG08_008002 [Elysia crispata]